MKALFDQGKDLKAYIEGGDDKGIRRKIDRLYSRIKETSTEGKKVQFPHVIIFSEFWCPDCLVLDAALLHLAEKFPQLKVRVLGKDGHESILNDHARDGKARIPLAIVLDKDFTKRGYISEQPVSLQDEVGGDSENHKAYRSGKYMQEVLSELKKLILA